MSFRSPDCPRQRHGFRRSAGAGCGFLLVMLASACSTTHNPESGSEDAASSAPRERPAGPASDVSEEITGGNGPFIAAAAGLTVPDGYVEHEYVASGMATAYVANGALTDDGRW